MQNKFYKKEIYNVILTGKVILLNQCFRHMEFAKILKKILNLKETFKEILFLPNVQKILSYSIMAQQKA